MQKRRVLLISPVFHGYYKGIVAALEALGFEVLVHCYDEAKTPLSKLQNRWATEDSARGEGVRARYSKQSIDALNMAKPDAVLLVKADLLDASWWAALEASKLPYSLWIYDELSNTKFEVELLQSLNFVASYSRKDTALLKEAGVDAAFVPGGFDSFEPYQPNTSLKSTVSFIGARYAGREAVLTEISRQGVNVKAFGREWSRRPIDIARTGRLRGPVFDSGPDLSRQDSLSAMAGSLATLNHHGHHDGFNLRMFEACGVGAIQLLDRTDASAFYEPNAEVLIYENPSEILAHLERIKTDANWANSVKTQAKARTLAQHTLKHRMADLVLAWN